MKASKLLQSGAAEDLAEPEDDQIMQSKESGLPEAEEIVLPEISVAQAIDHPGAKEIGSDG